MSSSMRDIDERTNLTNNNQFELLLFRLGEAEHSGQSELFGINVFKVREILVMPPVTTVVGADPSILGMADIRGQVIPVIDLPRLVGCKPRSGLGILLVTEYARSTQGFAVEAVEEIVRLEWNQVHSAEASVRTGHVTSIAKLEGGTGEGADGTDAARLVQVLDVEQILRDVLPTRQPDVDPGEVGPQLQLRPGAKVIAADDSALARGLIEQGLKALGAPVVMTKSGKEAWELLDRIATEAASHGRALQDEVALVLTDLEMPEMDGFTLTRKIKADSRLKSLPVVIHSSLSGEASEEHVRKVGADAYVAKFVAKELADTIRTVLTR
ncbi:chemotaxis protein [Cupriavidus taiwanensis]|uniref:Response regulator receiver, CheW-like domain n=1 Tax=Cupriavidus taiwanensis TaxID=164546 RepID=A0A975XH81_9BURK|nr:chemotaxis protein [Cupriavidus taiwanensis]MDK3021026.1 chemotaxis protein [Cupriavidus taiwanensis]NSX14236.1 chemotaxis protein CheV [Cupriavidus taiwanensis]SOY67949.1 putative Response regulator receiver, CheW-like domain [Cupriavidus taiwanensis]